MRSLGAGLLVLGLLQMAADLAGLSTLRGLAGATTASPAPRVFSAVEGLETYSSRFSIEWHDLDGEAHTLELTPEVYARLRGPYNRRNAYGAVLAYGPELAAGGGAPRSTPLDLSSDAASSLSRKCTHEVSAPLT